MPHSFCVPNYQMRRIIAMR